MRRTLLTASGWTVFLFAVYACLGLRPYTPDTIAAGEVCYRCRHVIVDARLAAEIMDRNLPTKYRTAGCMARYIAAHPRSRSDYYVTDFGSGGLVNATRAYFVPALINDTTGERDYRAYLSRAMAERDAQSLGSQVMTWSAVLARAAA